MDELLLILGMMVVTFSARYPVLAIFGRMPIPKPIFRVLRFVPTAVLTAICTPIIFMPEGEVAIAPSNAYLVASLIAILVSWKSRNLLLTILFGMGVFLGWRAIGL